MDKPKFCDVCADDGTETPLAGFIDGVPYCQEHLASVEKAALSFGLKVSDKENKPVPAPDPVKKLPKVIPPMGGDIRSLVDVLGHTLRGVLDGSYSPRQAEAVCNLSQTALKCAELEWKMNRSSEIQYIVKQLDAPPKDKVQ